MKSRWLLALAITAPVIADVKVKSRITAGGQVTETTVFTKGARQRMEYGSEDAVLQQCDLKRMIQINRAAKSYFVVALDAPAVAIPRLDGTPAAAEQPKGGVVTTTAAVTDTGERKQMFGLTARRVKSTFEKVPSPEACDQGKEKIETDGWYIDLDATTASCAFPQTGAASAGGAGCRDQVRHQQTGDGKLGYPLAYTMKTTGSDGKAQSVTMETVELSREALPAAMFEPPADFTERGSAREMVAATPKAAGMMRVGVAPVADRSGRLSAAGLDATLLSGLGEAKFDAVPLPGGTPEQVLISARQAQCDYVLFSDVAEVKKPSAGKRMGGLMARASGIINQKESLEARVDYRLLNVATGAPALTSAATGKSGGSSFNLAGAMNLAFMATNVFAMQKALGGLIAPNLMNSLSQMSAAGMSGGGMPGGGVGGMHPALSGMQFMMAQSPFGGQGSGTTQASDHQAASAALAETVKGVTAQLRKTQ